MRGLSRNFWLYLCAGMLWSLGLMVFFLTYNLHLLELGFREAFIGQVSASMTLGSLAATLPATFWLSRFGLNRVIGAAVLGTVFSLLARCTVAQAGGLLLFAFLNGFTIGTWMVAAPPFLAQNTSAVHRPRAFSLSYGGSIGMGAIAGVFVGKLPWLLTGLQLSRELSEQRLILIASIVLVGLAFFPLLFLTTYGTGNSRGQSESRQAESACSRLPTQRASHPGKWLAVLLQPLSSPFIPRLVIAIALWTFFVGSFPPFFNVFFATRHGQSLASIGAIFSLSQLCQLLAVLFMPWVVRKLGRVPAIVSMQLAAAFSLPLLALAGSVQLAAVLYLTYLSFQVMCEPALENFIMDWAAPGERNLLSSLRYATLFTAQAVAVWLTGIMIERHGYPLVQVGLTVVGILAALSFYFFFRSTPQFAGLAGGSQQIV